MKTDQEKIYYFAYGSNMDFAQMQKRIGDISEPIPVIKFNCRIIFDKYSITRGCGAANLLLPDNDEANLVSKEDYVEGVLYQLDKKQVTKLDKFEGIGSKRRNAYRKIEISVQDKKTDESYQAITYVAVSDMALKGSTTHKPSADYMQHLLAGSEFLSEEYISFLRSIEVNEKGNPSIFQSRAVSASNTPSSIVSCCLLS